MSQKSSLEACVDSDIVVQHERSDWVYVVSGFSVFRHWILEGEVSGFQGFSAFTRGLAELATSPEPSLRVLVKFNVTWVDADPVIISKPFAVVGFAHRSQPVEGTACIPATYLTPMQEGGL